MVRSSGDSCAERSAIDRVRACALPGLTLALMLWAYAGVWTAGAVYEDHNSVLAQEDAILEPSNPLVNDWTWFRRPGTNLSYRLTNNLGGGARAAHVESLLLHVAVVTAVGALALAVGAQPIVAAAVMALHPLASETVVYLSARGELLATLAIVLSLLAWCRERPLFGAIAAFTAFLCHPATAAALLGLLPLCLWRCWIPRRLGPEVWCLTLLLAVCVLAGAGAAWHTPELSLTAPWPVYVTRQAAGVVSLAGLLVWPFSLALDHSFGWLDRWDVLWRLAIGASVLGAAIYYRRQVPWLGFAAAWWIAGFGARLYIPSWNYLTEHHAYLPLVGVALLLGELTASEAYAW